MLLQNAIKDIQFAPNFDQSYHLPGFAAAYVPESGK
jgi:hypothetical protein